MAPITASIAVGAIEMRVALIDSIALLNAILMEALILCALQVDTSNFCPASFAARRAADLAASSALAIAAMILFTRRLVTYTEIVATV